MKQILKERSSFNIITGVAFQIINTIMGMALPYLFITNFGSTTNGFLASIGSLFVYLGMLEAGVGTATIQALYRPISQNDKTSVNQILSATNKYYLKTGTIYAALVIALSFIYPIIVKSTIPFSVVVSVIILNGAGSVWGFLIQAKYELLLRAEGKIYILNILAMITSLLRNAGKIIAIYLGFDIVMVHVIQLMVIIMASLYIVTYIKIKYRWVDTHVEPNYNAISQKKYVLIQQITWLVFNHTDIMVLTLVTKDLALVSVYSIYVLIYDSVQNLIYTVSNGFQYKLGIMVQDTPKEFMHYFEGYELFFYCIAFALNTIAYILTIPFLTLYAGEAKDANYIMRFLPELFLLMKALNTVRAVNKQPIEVAGHFKKTRYIPIMEMIINLSISLLLVTKLHIYGVVLGTIFALLYGSIMYARYNNIHIFMCNSNRGFGRIMVLFSLTVLFGGIGIKLVPFASNYGYLILYALPLSIIVVFGFIVSCIFILKTTKNSDIF